MKEEAAAETSRQTKTQEQIHKQIRQLEKDAFINKHSRRNRPKIHMHRKTQKQSRPKYSETQRLAQRQTEGWRKTENSVLV